jgi:hypothetical protein
VSPGFEGYVQSGAWAPIHIVASNDGDDIQGELRVNVQGLGTGGTTYVRSIDLPRGSRKLVTLYVADLSSFTGNVDVDLVSGSRVLETVRERVEFIAPTTLLIGILSDSPQPLADLADVKPSSGESRVAYLTPEDLPAEGQGWQALDILAISDTDTGQLTQEQQAAMEEWVVGGGRLVVMGGPSYQRNLAGLGTLSPVTVTGTQTVSLQPLASAAGAPLDEQVDADALIATGTLASDATVLLESEGAPLVVSRPLGQGQIHFLAADPGLEPLRSWSALGELWALILSSGEARPGWAFGFTDQWDYARNAASAIPGITLPSVIAMCGFLSLYVLLIGPLNYIVLARLKRRELAWLTIPLFVIVFSVVAYVTGFQLRGSEAVLHRLAIIQTWPDSPSAKVDTLVGIWSPRRSRYDIQVQPGYLVRPMPASTFGGGFGGAGLTSVGQKVIDEAEAMTMREVQVDVGSVQTFVVEGYAADPPRIEGDLSLTVQSESLRVQGEIRNTSDLDLSKVTLVAAGIPTKLDDLDAGESYTIDETLYPLNATPAGGLSYDPHPWNSYYNPYYYYGNYNVLAPSLVHIADCWSAASELKRDCDMVTSVLSAEWSGSHVYVFGWSDTVPVDMQVLNAASRLVDRALVIARLPQPQVTFERGALDVPPGLTTWRLLNFDPSQGYFSSPYDFYSSSTRAMTFRFEPVFEIEPSDIGSLIIHLQTTYGSYSVPRIWIRNFADSARWETVPVDWGNTTISSAADYIDPYGGVELRIQARSGYDIQISRFDVTLLGE